MCNLQLVLLVPISGYFGHKTSNKFPTPLVPFANSLVLSSLLRYGTLFLPAEFFSERGTMSLTTLLVFISLYTETSSTLPSTSYIKRIDIWFVFSIVYLTLIIMFHLVTCTSALIATSSSSTSTSSNSTSYLPISPFPSILQTKEAWVCVKNRKRLSSDRFILKTAQVGLGTFAVIFFVLYFGYP